MTSHLGRQMMLDFLNYITRVFSPKCTNLPSYSKTGARFRLFLVHPNVNYDCRKKPPFHHVPPRHPFVHCFTIIVIIRKIIQITTSFTKLPWPGDSKGIFRSSSQAASDQKRYAIDFHEYNVE